jgi:hypothetical protein
LIQDSSNTTRDIVTTWQTMLDWLLVHFVSEHQGWIWNWIFAGLFSFVCATGVVSRLTFEIATCHISSIQNPHSQPTWKSWCLKWDRTPGEMSINDINLEKLFFFPVSAICHQYSSVGKNQHMHLLIYCNMRCVAANFFE